MNFLMSFLIFFCLFNFSFAYSDETTHPALTDEIVDLFNLYYPELKISDEYKELVKKGSTDEDNDIRSMYHFYDPVYNRGVEFAETKWQSSKEWAQDTMGQAKLWDQVFAGSLISYFGSNTDHSWERAIYEYAWGDKERAMYDLGHILHLIEDASVPDHTRNDPHPPLFHFGSPYEAWTSQFDSEKMEGLAKSLYSASRKPVVFSDLQGYFNSIANYSNNNFFSKDTLPPEKNKIYENPKVDFEQEYILKNGKSILFAYYENRLVAGRFAKFIWQPIDEGDYLLKDPDEKIISDYWERLSRQAVLHGAGVMKLFFDEVEKEKQTKVLYNKNKSWFAKAYDAAKNKIFGISAILYGSSLKQNDLDELIGENENVRSSVSNTPTVRLREPSSVASPSVTPTSISFSSVVIEESEAGSNLASGDGVISAGVAPVDIGGAGIEEDSDENVKSSVSNILGSGSNFNTPRVAPENDNVSNSSLDVGSGTSSTPDVFPPDISFSISECENSLSSDGCLVASSATSFFWSSASTDIASYDIECSLSGNSCSNFSFSATSATSTNYSFPTDEKIYEFRARARDIAGNVSSWSTLNVEYYSSPVLINEVAWAGTSASSADEWIELYNKTGKNISLSGWVLQAQDQVPYINLSGTVSANGYYLIERTDDNTISNISADLIIPFSGIGSGSGLSNNGEVLILSRASTTVDQTVLCSNSWCGGLSSAGNPSMERIDPNTTGTDISNWGTSNNVVKKGKDANETNLTATPKSRNSLNYLISQTNTLSTNKILTKSQSPYVIPTSQDFSVNAGVSLIIEPGVVIKMGDQSSITVNGDITFSGTATDFITFTSIYDDSYEGDTNGDGFVSSPQAGDWKYVRIQSPSQSSQINYTHFKYGGRYFSFTAPDLRAMVSVYEATTTISNSIFEESQIAGLRATRFNGQISNNIFSMGTTTNTDKIGLYIYEGSPTISGSTFSNNYTGLTLENTAPNLDNLTFSNNYLGIQSYNSTINILTPGSITFANNTATTSPAGLF